MNESPTPPVYDSTPAAPEPFYQIWIKALTKPNEQTYAEIASAPGASTNKAYLWLILSYIVSSVTIMLVTTLFPSTQYGDFGKSLGSPVIAILCGAPFGALIGVLLFSLMIAIVQWVAKLFKGTGSFGQLIYAVAAFTAPLSLVSGLISLFAAIPYIGLCFSVISAGLGIYSLVLMVMAVKGVNKFGWGEAVGSVFLPGIVIAFVCGCLVVGILVLMGPIVGDVFSSISQSIGVY